MNVFGWLDRQPEKYHITICALLALGTGCLDYGMGLEYRMIIFYLVPISYATWFIGKKAGIPLSALPTMTWLYSGMVAGKTPANFPGEFGNMAMYTAFFIVVILLLSQLRITMRQRADLIAKLQQAIDAVKELSGILPICANCKKIRDDAGYWHEVEVYISHHTKAEFSHGICSACASKLYPSLFDKLGK